MRYLNIVCSTYIVAILVQTVPSKTSLINLVVWVNLYGLLVYRSVNTCSLHPGRSLVPLASSPYGSAVSKKMAYASDVTKLAASQTPGEGDWIH